MPSFPYRFSFTLLSNVVSPFMKKSLWKIVEERQKEKTKKSFCSPFYRRNLDRDWNENTRMEKPPRRRNDGRKK